MRRITSLVAVALALMTMLFVVSVVGAQKQSTSGAQQRATRTVSIQDFNFSPARITVRAGTKVTWVNNGNASHTVTANNGSFDSGVLQQGERFSRTFRKAGKFGYHCEIHPSMRGSVTVKR